MSPDTRRHRDRAQASEHSSVIEPHEEFDLGIELRKVLLKDFK